MVRSRWLVAATAAWIAGCAAAGPSTTGDAPAQPDGPIGSPFGDSRATASLVLDRTDLRLGTTVHFNRVPSAAELYKLEALPSLAHIVLSLPAWPPDYAPLQELNQMPGDADLIVILPGFPPSRAAAEAWNLVGAPLRLVVLVREPPPNRTVIDDLNTMRGLERVIAELDDPARTGFERLQRPLSFRKVID